MFSPWSFISGLVLLSSFSFVFATWSDGFAGFFPKYNHGFQQILHNECADKYTEYLKHSENSSSVDPILKTFGLGVAHNVVDCLLDAVPEIIKAKMASAQVTILQFNLGNSLLMSLGCSRVQSLSSHGSRVLS